MLRLAPTPPRTIAERQTLLEAELVRRVRAGWHIVERTTTTAHLARKRPWWSTVLIMLLVPAPPIVVHYGVADEMVHLVLEVREDGTLRRRVPASS
jgi:hypothetical protein